MSADYPFEGGFYVDKTPSKPVAKVTSDYPYSGGSTPAPVRKTTSVSKTSTTSSKTSSSSGSSGSGSSTPRFDPALWGPASSGTSAATTYSRPSYTPYVAPRPKTPKVVQTARPRGVTSSRRFGTAVSRTGAKSFSGSASGFVGMNTQEVKGLARVLQGLQSSFDDGLHSMTQAEFLSGLTSGLGPLLSGIGQDSSSGGSQLAARAGQADGTVSATVSKKLNPGRMPGSGHPLGLTAAKPGGAALSGAAAADRNLLRFNGVVGGGGAAGGRIAAKQQPKTDVLGADWVQKAVAATVAPFPGLPGGGVFGPVQGPQPAPVASDAGSVSLQGAIAATTAMFAVPVGVPSGWKSPQQKSQEFWEGVSGSFAGEFDGLSPQISGTGLGADRVLLNRDPLGIAPLAAKLHELEIAAERGQISDNDPRLDAAARDLRRQVAKHAPAGEVTDVFAAIVAGRPPHEVLAPFAPSRPTVPNWADPGALSDAELHEGVTNWKGTDNDPLLDGLVAELHERMGEPDTNWTTLAALQHTTEIFGDRANELGFTVLPGDQIGMALADDLGFGSLNDEIAGAMRVRFNGEWVYAAGGVDAAIDGIGFRWASGAEGETLGRFIDVAHTQGVELVTGHHNADLAQVRTSVESMAGMAGYDLTDDAFAVILSIAVKRGGSATAVAREYFGIDLDDPPADHSRADVLEAEVSERHFMVAQHQAELDAMALIGGLGAKFDQRFGPNLSTMFASSEDPDAIQLDHNGMWVQDTVLNRGRNFVEAVSATFAPTEAEFANQAHRVALETQFQQGVFAAGTPSVDHPIPGPAQQALLADFDRHHDEFQQLLLTRYSPDLAQGYRLPPILAHDGVVGRDAVNSWDDVGPAPVSVEVIRAALEDAKARLAAPPGVERTMSAGFIEWLEAVIDDPVMVTLLAPRGGDILDTGQQSHLDPERFRQVPEQASLASILEPFGDEIDSVRRGGVNDHRVAEDYLAWADKYENDPAVPTAAILAARQAAKMGATDTNLLSITHLTLDFVGMVPVVGEVADAVNAGLYLAVDRDPTNAALSAVALVPVAGSAATGARTGDRVAGAFQTLRVTGAELGDRAALELALRRADGPIGAGLLNNAASGLGALGGLDIVPNSVLDQLRRGRIAVDGASMTNTSTRTVTVTLADGTKVRVAAGASVPLGAADTARVDAALTVVGGDGVVVTFGATRSAGSIRLLGQRELRDKYLTEYERQLRLQEQVLSEMTASDYLRARDAFADQRRLTGSGRNPRSVQEQDAARTRWIRQTADDLVLDSDFIARHPNASFTELRGLAKVEAREQADLLHALHNPDQVAGGYFTSIDLNAPVDELMGLGSVNASIGSQWRWRVGQLDAVANLLQGSGRGDQALGVVLAQS